MIKKIFTRNLYVKVYRNRFDISIAEENGAIQSFSAPEVFTTKRLLVGSFTNAEHCLKNAIKRVLPKKLFRQRPAICIQPMEMTDGGLSEVEERVFRELALGAGAYKVILWVGSELSKDEVNEKLGTE